MYINMEVFINICRDKHVFVATSILFVATKEVFCRGKHVFVATKVCLYFSRDKIMFVTTNVCHTNVCHTKHVFFSRQNYMLPRLILVDSLVTNYRFALRFQTQLGFTEL